MRLPVRRTTVLVAAAMLPGALAACSLGGTSSPAAATTTSKAPAQRSAPATFDPLAGPIESAAQLPKSCSKILSDQDLTTAFGSPQVGDTTYGNYAPLPNIGRTGRVTCSFIIGIDPYGHAQPAGATVSVITYDTAVNAASRAVREIKDTVAAGAVAQPVMVSGHPATIMVKAASAPAAPTTAAAPSRSAAAPSSPAAQPAASPSAAAPAGYTELVMSDGNRTFVITIPSSKVSGNAAVTTLISMMGLVYQNTLPQAAAAPAPSAKATASPKPSAT